MIISNFTDINKTSNYLSQKKWTRAYDIGNPNPEPYAEQVQTCDGFIRFFRCIRYHYCIQRFSRVHRTWSISQFSLSRRIWSQGGRHYKTLIIIKLQDVSIEKIVSYIMKPYNNTLLLVSFNINSFLDIAVSVGKQWFY